MARCRICDTPNQSLPLHACVDRRDLHASTSAGRHTLPVSSLPVLLAISPLSALSVALLRLRPVLRLLLIPPIVRIVTVRLRLVVSYGSGAIIPRGALGKVVRRWWDPPLCGRLGRRLPRHRRVGLIVRGQSLIRRRRSPATWPPSSPCGWSVRVVTLEEGHNELVIIKPGLATMTKDQLCVSPSRVRGGVGGINDTRTPVSCRVEYIASQRPRFSHPRP